MKLIALTQGQFAMVDDADFHLLEQWKWQAAKAGRTYYAQRTDRGKTPRGTIKMHRFILGLLIDDIRLGDHKDHNGLNNQRDNLRICSDSENNANRSRIINSASRFLGVVHKVDKRSCVEKHFWYAQLRKDGITHFLGSFPFTESGEIAAAKAYDLAALKHHGNYSNLNFPVK